MFFALFNKSFAFLFASLHPFSLKILIIFSEATDFRNSLLFLWSVILFFASARIVQGVTPKNLDSLVKPENDVFFAWFLMNRQFAMIIATQPLDRGIQNPSKRLDSRLGESPEVTRFRENDDFLWQSQFMDVHYIDSHQTLIIDALSTITLA